MQLRAWRKSLNLTLQTVASRLGISVPHLHELETGRITVLRPEMIAKIRAATGGAVTFHDHLVAWEKANVSKFAQSRADGRAARKSFEPGRNPEKKNGNSK